MKGPQDRPKTPPARTGEFQPTLAQKLLGREDCMYQAWYEIPHTQIRLPGLQETGQGYRRREVTGRDPLLEPLVGTLRTIRPMIDDHRSYLQKNETRTRNVLIDPVLRSLGWEVSQPDDVGLEYSVQRKRVDYALLGDDERPLILVEAKKLYEGLDPHRDKLLNYCTGAGVPYAILTDGNCWDLYHAWQEKPLDERRIDQIIITSREPPVAAQMFLKLWKTNVRAGRWGLGDTNNLGVSINQTKESTQ